MWTLDIRTFCLIRVIIYTIALRYMDNLHILLNSHKFSPIFCANYPGSLPSGHIVIKGLFGEIMPSALLANASLGLLRHFATSFCSVIFCNVILIPRIILIFRFGQNHRHRPHNCACRQQWLDITLIFCAYILMRNYHRPKRPILFFNTDHKILQYNI